MSNSVYIYICLCVCECVFNNSSTRAGCDTRSVFNGGFNSKFSFFETRLKKTVCPTIYFLIAGGKIIGFKSISAMGNAVKLISPCPFPTTVNITPRTPPKLYLYICIWDQNLTVFTSVEYLTTEPSSFSV